MERISKSEKEGEVKAEVGHSVCVREVIQNSVNQDIDLGFLWG